MYPLLTEFPITIYEKLVPVSQVLSKSRCRIFYKYGNWNGSYITDEFAEKLIKTLPYTPVKGIYDEETEDYTDHGTARSQGRIYGIVPQDHNFAWEKHLDDDGVERTYACADVYLFTGIYKEAADIVGKPQSMELYRPSIKGQFEIIEGKRFYKYTDACFLGLEVLGNDVTPCFEGAAFFSLDTSATELLDKIKQFELACEKQKMEEKTMDIINFKLSDSEKETAIWSLLNLNYNEENNYIVDYGICAVYDDYALVRNYGTGDYERVYYSKDDDSDSLKLGDRIKCFIVDVTESEKTALDTIQKLNNNTFEKIDETFAAAQDSVASLTAELEAEKEKVSDFSLKNEQLMEEKATLETENQNLQSNYALLETENGELKTQNEELAAFKKGIEDDQKRAVLESYSGQLEEEVIEKYTAAMDTYTARDLDKELAYELKLANPSVFTASGKTPYVLKETELTGIEAVLSQYSK